MKTRGYDIWAPVLGLVALAGCKSTYMLLHVQAPGDADLSNSIVRLIDDGQPVCGGGLLFYGRTDPAGRIRVDTPACGDVQLVVTRQGRGTYVRALDTCEVSSLDITLPGTRGPAGESGSCEAVASDFVAAWVAAEHEHARSFWLVPEAYEPYARNASAKPWAVDVGSGAIEGRTCRVAVTEYYDTACDFRWQVELEQSDDRGWGVRALSQQP